MPLLPYTPSLGTMTISRGSMWRYRYPAPHGQAFPYDTSAWVVVSDRAGAEVARFEGDISPAAVTWAVDPPALEGLEAGFNFEMYIETSDEIAKVQYGRVVRADPMFPLNPVTTDLSDAVQYEDQLQRTAVGRYWISKFGQAAMFTASAPKPEFSMAVRNVGPFGLTLWQDCALLWYAPLRSDTVELSVGLMAGGPGGTTIHLCSNYAMTRWLGVKFLQPDSGPATVRFFTGNGGPLTGIAQGAAVTHSVPSDGGIYTIRYSIANRTATVFTADDLVNPLLSFQDTSGLVTNGMGYRYMGASWQASLASTGPRMYYWKSKDSV